MELVILEKFRRFENLSDRIMRCDVVLKKEKNEHDNDFVVEAKLSVPGNDLFAKKSGPKFEIAAEDVCLNLEKQWKKMKEKVNGKR